MKWTHLFPVVALVGVAGTVASVGHRAIAQSPNPSPVLDQVFAQATPEGDRLAAPEDGPIGGLYGQTSEGDQANFVLTHTDVQANVSGNLARVEVTQTFENPFEDPLEAIYVFPLPDEAAVDDMEIRIGDRVIRGEIKPREEAQAIYEQAVAEGRTAGLLEQERDNIFTQSLANILPGEQIEVTIRYSESLKFEGGDYEFMFPMVVGPRYIPGTPLSVVPDDPSTNIVPDASRITPPVLRPDERSGHDISVRLRIDAGVPIDEVRSPSHEIQVTRSGDGAEIQLAPGDTIPNKDLIVRYQVSGDRTQATVLTHRNEQGGHFAVYLIPALDYRSEEIVPKDVVFLMDTSGSQSGDPLLKSQELMRRMINGLNPDDTFTIIDFSDSTQQLSATPLANTSANRRRAIAYVDQLSADGGTNLLNGIRTVLNFPPAPEGRLRSIVLLTDGYIGDDTRVLAEVQQNLQEGNRLYSFGVGSSVNRFLLDRLAEVGRGTFQVIRQDEPSEEVADRFFRQINNPVLTNIEVTWEGDGEAPILYPSRSPDLFAEQPLVLYGRQAEGINGRLRIRGIAAGGVPYEETIAVNFDQEGSPAIAQLWGRARIKELMDRMYVIETTSGVSEITQTALAYRLLSQYTAFVAVSEEVRVDPDGTRRTVDVPVELPEGVSYEGIFGTERDQSVLQGGFVPPVAPVPGARSGGGFSNATPLSGAVVYPLDESGFADFGVPQITGSDRLESRLGDLEVRALGETSFAGNEADIRQQFDNHFARLLIQEASLLGDTQGTIVLEVTVVDGYVESVVWDDLASTIQDPTIAAILKDSLTFFWLPELSDRQTIEVVVEISE